MAPVGLQGIFHDDKETGLAEVCAEIGVPFILSTAATSSIEDVAKASGDGPRWFQLYTASDNDINVSVLDRAKANGFKVLVITLDTWALSWRPADLDLAYAPFLKGKGDSIGRSDPVFCKKFEEKNGVKVEQSVIGASFAWTTEVFPGMPLTWEKIDFLKKHWDGPVVLKGVQHVEDAKLAVEHGCEGIVVSNHGGAQFVFLHS